MEGGVCAWQVLPEGGMVPEAVEPAEAAGVSMVPARQEHRVGLALTPSAPSSPPTLPAPTSPQCLGTPPPRLSQPLAAPTPLVLCLCPALSSLRNPGLCSFQAGSALLEGHFPVFRLPRGRPRATEHSLL